MKKNDYHIETSLKQLLGEEEAYHYRIVPFKLLENKILCCKTDQTEINTLNQELSIVLGKKIQLEVVSTQEIQNYLRTNYRQNNDQEKTDLHDSKDVLLKIIHQAKAIGSSDIHFEVFEKKSRVRFRIDGKLIERFIIPMEDYAKISNRIKILAGADISEKRLPQDGRITLNTEEEELDIRVSFLPTIYGEKIVLRLLTKDTSFIELDELGFTALELKRYKEAVKKTNGMVLISGPTGSGKTTTLYATLKVLNTDETNILTIEDPVEYTLEGVNQVQLKEGIGLNFASTLRSFLRQDPDIIMVGEIRDVDTANMAIRASLTGHLVLSTIHTNSAWATVSRLIDMGIPPFLVASTLNVSIAQRLVRKLCTSCKEEVPIENHLFPEQFAVPKELKTHYKAVGCPSCYYTGYKGRKAIYEIIPITVTLAEKIKQQTFDISDYIAEHQIQTLTDNALDLIKKGTTSIEEVYTLLI